MDFEYSPRVKDLQKRLNAFMDEHVYPNEPKYYAHVRSDKRWEPVPIIDELKPKARAAGLWNLFLPHSKRVPEGLSNLEYAPLCEIMGRVSWAPEVFNCSAPDTGNMETIERYGSEEHKRQWLDPLLRGEIRSAFLMTEPAVASSDATNIQCRIKREGDNYVINGTKWWSSGAGDPRCKIYILMGKTDPDNTSRHAQQSMVLVPHNTPGIKILRHLNVFGYDDAPHGHMEIELKDVKVPVSNILLGEGRGFEIAQGRLGPGRIHHCMRSIGQAEKALDLMVRRGLSREAFGRPLVKLGGNMEIISRARIDIEAMRLMVLKAAKAMDVMGNREARVWVHMVKAQVPERVCQIIDQAMQMHGATGVSQWSPLSRMYAKQRTLRLADGPDEVHHMVVGRHECQAYEGIEDDPSASAVWRS